MLIRLIAVGVQLNQLVNLVFVRQASNRFDADLKPFLRGCKLLSQLEYLDLPFVAQTARFAVVR